MMGELTFRKYSRTIAEERLSLLIKYVAYVDYRNRMSTRQIVALLWLIDRESFLKLGQPLSGFEYVKTEHGIQPLNIDVVLDEMVTAREIRFKNIDEKTTRIDLMGYGVTPDLFNRDETRLIEQIVHQYRDIPAEKIEEISCGIAWKVAQMGELIPYEAAIISDDQHDLTSEDIRHLNEIAQQYNLDTLLKKSEHEKTAYALEHLSVHLDQSKK